MLLQPIREALVTQRQNSNARGDEDEIEVARLKCPQYFGEVDITIIITYILVIQTLYSKVNITRVYLSAPRWRCCWTSQGPPPSPRPGS